MWKKIFALALIAWLSTCLYGGFKNIFLHVPPLPPLEEPWWGSGKPFVNEDTNIRTFTINVSSEVLTDLHQRLDHALPFQPPLEGVQQQYGFNTNYLKKVLNFWRTEYDWIKREKILNKFPQYITSVQGLKIHYLHVKPELKSKDMKVIPLLIMHGWPSSFTEFLEFIPLLIHPNEKSNFVFEVIAPSLPGYAFSEGAVRPGLNPMQIAIVFKNLMKRLGFEKYYLHGGDWGSQVATAMATIYPEKIIGLHTNFCFVNTPLAHLKLFIGSYFPSLIASDEIRDKVYPLSKRYTRWMEETGYMHIQATKPDTIGVALRDSPIGLAAYLLEKYSVFTHPQWKNLEEAGLSKKFKLEDLLDNVMIYWITRSITTSMRLYAEGFSKEYYSLKLSQIPTSVPTGCVRFSQELVYQPEIVLKDKYSNLVHAADYEGGHFAAVEVPNVLANDLYSFVSKVEILR